MKFIRTLIWSVYALVSCLIQKSGILYLLRVDVRRVRGFIDAGKIAASEKSTSGKSTGSKSTWFHASSQGELESLIPLMEGYLARGERIVATVFSASAIQNLNQWMEQHRQSHPDSASQILYTGFSPAEVDWGPCFKSYQCNQIVTTRYEAWPGLWYACVVHDVAIVIIQAEWRSSLKFIKNFLPALTDRVPKLLFVSSEIAQKKSLLDHFEGSVFLHASDPRRLRILNRIARVSESVQIKLNSMLDQLKSYPRPWIWVGSAWPEDLNQLWCNDPNAIQFRGTWVVFPHRLDSSSIQALETVLSQYPAHRGKTLLIQQMGILVESYLYADAAMVGGGYGRGVHSTLEPALLQMPVCCGPNKTECFAEIKTLVDSGVLTICRDSVELGEWVQKRVPRQNTNQLSMTSDIEKQNCIRLVEQCLQFRYDQSS